MTEFVSNLFEMGSAGPVCLARQKTASSGPAFPCFVRRPQAASGQLVPRGSWPWGLEDVANFKGSPLEKQAALYCKRLGINYNKLSDVEFRQLVHILEKSKFFKSYVGQRKKRK